MRQHREEGAKRAVGLRRGGLSSARRRAALLLTVPLLSLSCYRLGFDSPYGGNWPDPSVERLWRQVQQLDNPGRLTQPRMVYHAGRRTVLLYGGELNIDSGVNIISDQLWELDGYAWTRLCRPCGPGPRIGHGLAYDEKRDRLVLFGGQDGEGVADDELWEWDGANSWERRRPAGTGPSARHGHYMAYDPVGGRTLVYGGQLEDGGESDELFAYDGERWQAIAPGETWPSSRYDAGTPAVFDRYQGLFIFYGGYGGSYHDDMWAFDGEAWKQLCDDCTGVAREGAGFVFDLASGRLVLFNGYDGSEIAGTWEWDGDAFDNPFPGVPGQRDSLGSTYDEAQQRIVAYGGDGRSCNDPEHCDALIEFVLEPR